MKLELIREFQVFANRMNFTTAARDLGITQSCLSKHMAELERETELCLIDRDGNELNLTSAGEVFLRETSMLLVGYENALQKSRAVQSKAPKSLMIQELFSNHAMYKLYELIDLYSSTKHDAPEDIYFSMVNDMTPVQAIETGEFDICISVKCLTGSEHESLLKEQGFQTVFLLAEPLVAWFQSDHPLLSKSDLEIEDFRSIPFLMGLSSHFNYMKAAINDLFEANDIHLMVKEMTRRGGWELSDFVSTKLKNGVLFTTLSMIDDRRFRSRRDIEYRVLDNEAFTMSFFLFAKEDNKVAADFLDFVRQSNLE